MAHGGTMYLESIARPNSKGVGWSIKDIINRVTKLRLDDEIPEIQHGAIHHRGYFYSR
jgi:hypothetical protein